MSISTTTPKRLLGLNKVIEKIDVLGKSAIYARLNPNHTLYDPSFPKPIKLGHGKNPTIAFLEHELDEWIENKTLETRGSQ
jgi:prophage regulatory protein